MAYNIVSVENLAEFQEGIRTLQRLTVPPLLELLGQPWKRAMDELAVEAERMAKAGAPKGKTGQLASRTFARVQKKPFPMWLAVRSRAKRRSASYPGGYPYPRLLEFSPKHGHENWFSGGLGDIGGKVEAALAKAGDEMGRRWARR